MALKFTDPATSDTWNVLLYGAEGSGKTTAACSAPGPVLVLNAEGPGALAHPRRLFGNDKIREVEFTGREVFSDVRNYLRSDGQDVRTVVLDTIGEIRTRLAYEAAGSAPRPSMQQWGDVANLLGRFLRFLRDSKLNTVLVAHEEIVQDDDGVVVRPLADGSGKLAAQLAAQVDIVAYCGIRKADDGSRQYLGQLVADRGRRGKDRSDSLGAVRALDLTDWFTRANAHQVTEAAA